MIGKDKIDYPLMLAVLFVIFAGIFTLYTQEYLIEEGEGRWYKQAFFFLFGLILMLVLYRVNLSMISDYAILFYALSIFLLLITLIPFIGSEIKGARSWIRFGPVGLQTSELAKFAMIILLARYLEVKEKEIDRIPSLVLAFFIGLVPMLLIVVQPDFGGAFSIAPILITLLFVAGADFYHLGSVIVFFSVSLSIPLYIEYHRITLVEPLTDYLTELGKTGLLPAVRILRNDIWKFVDDGSIPENIDGSDRDYILNILNSDLFDSLKEAADAVKSEFGGFLLILLDNEILLVVIASLLVIVAASLFVIRFTQGRSMSHLRKYYIPFGVLGLSLFAALTVHLTFSFKYHQIVRVTAFVSPEKFPRDLAYQIRASKAAIGSGEITGQGFFRGDMTMGERPLVPEAYTDFIFTSWAERTGFLGTLLLLIAIMYIPLRSLQISLGARDRFASLLGSGIAFMYLYHIIINTGITLGLLPVTGLPLSFMSYGGSHLVVCLAGIGIIMNIYRRRFAN
ncbi:MAG: FtsW/RodA/SpoVE family cell cycle protein [Spirochaetia bacterium]|nr:FtsW/RodA/SpoVE family cell cycle protein [Spirochaetia bacterium]